MAEVEKRPEPPVSCSGKPGSMYGGTYYENSAIALAAYTADDRQWLLKLCQRQRTYMEHFRMCPRWLHPHDKNNPCTCGMSDYLAEVLT